MQLCAACPHRKKRPRSVEDHKRFFALIKAAYSTWPESHDFQPESEEHLRAYLLCAAGYRQVTDVAVPYAEDQPAVTRLVAISIEAAIKAAGAYAFIRPDANGGRVAVYRAKSIKFETLDQAKFGPVREAVENLIETALGTKVDTILAMEEAAA